MNFQYTLRKIDRDTWLRLVPEFSDYNYRQSWEFGIASAKRVGAVSEHIAIEHPVLKTVIGMADVRIKTLPVVGGGIAYINGGPLLCKREVSEKSLLPCVVNALVDEYVIRRKFTLRIAPPIIADTQESPLGSALIHAGFEEMQQEKKTILLDLSLDEIEIRNKFHQKWRNCLNKSERNELNVVIGNDIVIFQRFIPLFHELIREKKFSVDLDIGFYENVQKSAVEKDKFVVMLAEYQGQPVAGHVASILGDTSVYLLGAANSIGRQMNAAYLLQWRAIQMGKELGCRSYDLGGIDSEGNPGVYTFKKRMGGQERSLPGPYQLSLNGPRAKLTHCAEKLYNNLKSYLIA
jgi:lipid II:glycine glycyltransferase (peptidoglycan interpeptide bridge formation enzyme)